MVWVLLEEQAQAADAVVPVEQRDRLVQVFLAVDRDDHLQPQTAHCEVFTLPYMYQNISTGFLHHQTETGNLFADDIPTTW